MDLLVLNIPLAIQSNWILILDFKYAPLSSIVDIYYNVAVMVNLLKQYKMLFMSVIQYSLTMYSSLYSSDAHFVCVDLDCSNS